MQDDNSLDIFGAKPLSKAVEKVTERSVDGISNFFGAICMPAAEEFGLLLRDKVSAYRKMNLESIAAKTKKKSMNKGCLRAGTPIHNSCIK